MSVEVRRLAKHFAKGGLPAVNEVSFTAPSGAITALLGPSGSGKTTVLRLIAGLEEPDQGTVIIGGRDCSRVPVRHRGVGFVFQGYALFDHMTVRDNVAFGLTLQRLPKDEIAARVEEWLTLVQLRGFGARYPAQLSGGQRQRVAFARSLATRPNVLLLDEPFGALDARVRLELREWLKALNEKTQVTTILVTHDQDEALEVSAHVVVMNGGKVEQTGAPHEVYDKPASAFVASFMGAPNVLRGKVEAGRAAVGALSVSVPHGVPDGAGVSAYVRPHEVKLTRTTEGGASVTLGTIESLVRVGATVRVNLTLPTQERITVQLPRAEFEALGASEGDRVLVDIGGARLFVGDYAI